MCPLTITPTSGGPAETHFLLTGTIPDPMVDMNTFNLFSYPDPPGLPLYSAFKVPGSIPA